jgi:hypothetical protein
MTNLTKALSRRTFLQGTGAAVSLPLLGAMAGTSTAASANAMSPKRVAFVYVPHGMVMTKETDWWTPPTQGAQFTFSPTLKPLEKFRRHVTVVSNLTGAEGTGQHAGAASGWLTDAPPKMADTPELQAGTSIDQIIAAQHGRDTPIRSMQLAVEDLGGLVGLWHTGYNCKYLNSVSWASPSEPLRAQLQPRAVFDSLYATRDAVAAPRQANRRSILDSVLDDSHRLSRRLGTADRARLDAYLTDIRRIEQRIQRAESGSNAAAPALSRAKTTIPYAEHVELMFDLMQLAFQADATRVSSLMLAREMSHLTYPQIGVADPHHALSHHQNSAEAMRKLGEINRYHVALFSKFVERLAQTPEGDGSLLDRTLLVYGSGMSNGNDHDRSRLPTVLVSGFVKGNRHVALAQPRPIGDLHAEIARQMDVPLAKFGRHGSGSAIGLS